MSVQICDVQHWEKTIPLYSLLTMPEWSWPEFMSDRSMMSNQATKIKLHGTLLQICNTDTTTTALVNCYPLLIQSENPTRQHHSSCPFLFETCSFETNTTPCTSYFQWLIDQGQSSCQTGAWCPTKPQRKKLKHKHNCTKNCYFFHSKTQSNETPPQFISLLISDVPLWEQHCHRLHCKNLELTSF